MNKCPFQIGEKIVCITLDWDKTPCTIGKTYIVKAGYLYIMIKGDNNSSFIPDWKNFITLKEYRKRKIQKINKLN